MDFNLSRIAEVAIRVIRETQLYIQREITEDPASAFEEAAMGRRQKPLLTIDLVAERNTAYHLRAALRSYSLHAIGEESLRDPSLDLSKEEKLVVLMDMVDGTDLLERQLFNWCSAMIFYYPPDRKILASFVGIPEEGVYYATEQEERAFKYRFHGHPRLVDITGPSEIQDVGSASLAFYGQKIPNFLSVAKHRRFLSRLGTVAKQQNPKTRIYNLAGNPMMMRLIDGYKRIDAVFDLEGQAPHDVVPGAYIAQKAKAVLRDLSGHPINLHQSLVKPANPVSRISYILASTESLFHDLQKLLAD